MFEPCQYFNTSDRSFDCRNVDVSERQFAIHFYIGDKYLMQARVTNLADEHFGDFLANTVRYALETDTGWHISTASLNDQSLFHFGLF
jgi:hypothetical protein